MFPEHWQRELVYGPGRDAPKKVEALVQSIEDAINDGDAEHNNILLNPSLNKQGKLEIEVAFDVSATTDPVEPDARAIGKAVAQIFRDYVEHIEERTAKMEREQGKGKSARAQRARVAAG